MKITQIHFENLKKYYNNYLALSKKIGDSFGGPSMYFHRRALSERETAYLEVSHLEMIYATLTAWGMHRMGETKTKIVNFPEFQSSILANRIELENLRYIKLEDIKPNELNSFIERLNKICFSLHVSASDSKIVGNTKTLAHILPDLIPPIDRQYTIRFFKCDDLNKVVGDFKDTQEESEYFNFIMIKAFDFVNQIKNDKLVKIDNDFNTSYPKIFDNLIMTYVKNINNRPLRSA